LKFVDHPTERTTAATDIILAGLGLAGMFFLLSWSHFNPWKAGLWTAVFGLMALAAALGAIAHGFQMSATANRRWWIPLNLSLSLTVAFFLVGVIYDLWGLAVAQRILTFAVAMGLVFLGVTLLFPSKFLVFILYEAAVMLFALGGYIWLAVEGQLPGTGWMAGGVLVTLIAAAVQVLWDGRSKPLTLIWQFDQNGLFHLIQMVGGVLLLIGLRAGLMGE
jgi:hypothetical protein